LVEHCFSTKVGGYSSEQYQSLNLALHVNDQPSKVVQNRQLLADLLVSELSSLVAGEQVHSTNIAVVDQQNLGQGAFKKETAVPATDALITDQSGVLLSSYYADCTPLFFLAPEIPAVGLAHAGWQGTVKKIAQKTALMMDETYGAKLENLLVGIGPHIGPCCYQVDQQVVGPLADGFDNWEEMVENDGENKWRLDLAKANRIQLEEIGVKSTNIINSNLCTSCCSDLFYSYRRDKGQTGRMASLIKIK
jgi:YfiH family protein